MSNMQSVDILAIGAHPDDIELCCGGTMCVLASKGYKTAILDLTRGELGTGGNVEIRDREVEASSRILGLAHRENLNLPDGGITFGVGTDGQGQVKVLVATLRRLKPRLIFAPYAQERHPDHVATHALIKRAIFFAGLKKYDQNSEHDKWVPLQVVYYQMRFPFRPSFVVDISSVSEQKMKAISCYQSQLRPASTAANDQTLVNSSGAMDALVARDRYYGAFIGSERGEAFFTETALRIDDPFQFFTSNPTKSAHYFLGND